MFRHSGGQFLSTQSKSLNQIAVATYVFFLQIIQKLAALVNHTNETTTGVMVFVVIVEVALQGVDIMRQQCHLNLGRARITVFELILLNDFRFTTAVNAISTTPKYALLLPSKTARIDSLDASS